MEISFILGVISIILIISIYLLLFPKKKSLKKNIFIAFGACIFSIAVLVFPLLEYDNTYVKSFASFIYAMKCAGMGQDLSVLSKINLETTNGYLHFIVMNILFLAAPILTASFILAYLEKIVAHIKLALSKNRKLYVFSEINDKSLLLCKKLQKEKSATIIFSNVKEKTDINVKGIKLNKKITDITFNPKSDITFYMISQNEEQNLNETLELIDKYKDRDKTKIYVINRNEETPTLLDSMDKGKITVEIINEKERAIFNLLDNKPLFLNAIDKTISILIVGCGNIGKEFLRDAVWCGMMPDFKLKILVVDNNADKIKENINVEMPELLNNYDITFLNEDVKSAKAIKMIKSRHDINYILVSMDTDDKNIDAAIMLRRLFLREFDREPVISLHVDNEYKQEQILSLSNEKGNKYNLNAFGSITELYDYHNIIDSELERLAIKVHLAYDPEDKDLKRYNLREYNKRSSRASALHIKYKLYSILGDKFTEDMKENQKVFRSMYTPEIEKLLSRNEHDRWNAYMRSIGYVCASIKEVEKYYNKTKHHIHYLARMHPALVEYDKLDSVSKELSKITSRNIDLKENDRMIIKKINESIDL